MLRFQMTYPEWLLDFSLTFSRGCCGGCVALAEEKEELAVPRWKRGKSLEAGKEPGISGTQAIMSQQPNAIAKATSGPGLH